MASPELSVFITSYNSELYIREAITSILNQSYTDFELIIIDNASTDNTLSIIKSFTDNRIQLISHPQNIGIIGSRNQALEIAKGTFISFLDSDDIAHPKKFEKQIEFLKANPDFGFVGSSVILINGKGIETSKWKLNAKPDMIPGIMLFNNYFVNSAVTFRRDLVKAIRYTEVLTIGEDYIMWFYLLQKSKGINIPEYLTSYRQHPKSIIALSANQREEYDKKVYEIIFQHIGLQATDVEFDIHLSLKNYESVSSRYKMQNSLLWLKKISQSAQDAQFIDNKTLSGVLLNRWLKLCYKARSNPGLLLYGLINILFNSYLFFNCRWLSKKQ